MLAGFGLLLFFALLRAVLKSRVMPTVSKSAGGRALASLLRYGFLVALVVIVLGFALAFNQTQRTTVDADEIISDFKMAIEAAAASESKLEAIARLDELEDSAFRAAVITLVGQSKDPNAPRGIDRALELLRQGETGAAETALAEILDQRLQERATASAEAAEAARNLGVIAYLNDTAKAIKAYQTATELDPDETWSWIYLGRLHQRAGNLAAAEQAFQEAREAAERAGNDRDVMVADNSLGDVRVARGDLSGAAAAYGAALEAAKQRAAQDPSNTEWQRDLSVSFEKIGDVRSARGNLEAALQAYQDVLAIAEKLAAHDPSNSEWQRDLSVSFNKIGEMQRARGDLDAALQAYQDSRAIREKLAAQDPSNAEWQRDLAVSFSMIGDVQSARGNLEAALQAHGDGLAIVEKLAAQDPSNSGWQRDLSVSFSKIGDVQSARGDLEAALKAYGDGLAIREKLAAQDPSNTEWQRDLAVSYERLGDIDAQHGDDEAAASYFQRALEIRTGIATREPTAGDRQRELIVPHWRLGDLAAAREASLDKARQHYQAAFDIAKTLAATNRLAPTDAWMVGELETRLEQVKARTTQ